MSFVLAKPRGVYLKDLVFVSEVHEDCHGDLVNYEKLECIGACLLELHVIRQRLPPMPAEDAAIAYFRRPIVLPEEVLYKHSEACEPPNESFQEIFD